MRLRAALPWAIAALAVTAAMGALAWRPTEPPLQPEMRFDITAPNAGFSDFALSPDGTMLTASVSSGGPVQLWLRHLGSTTWQPLPGTEGALMPFWSPDGRALGFFAGGKLKRIDIRGGAPQTLADASARGGAWSADGTIVFAPNPSGVLSRISAAGGAPGVAITPPGQTAAMFPSFLPDERRFLFFLSTATDARGVYLGTLGSNEIMRVVPSDGTANGSAVAYLRNGWLLFHRQGILRAQRFDVARAEVIGDEVAIGDANLYDGVSTSTNGLITYRAGTERRTRLMWVDRSGKALAPFGPSSDVLTYAPRLSHDEQRAVVSMQPARSSDILVVDEARITRFTFDSGADRYPVWAPDGKSIVFDSNRSKGRHLFLSNGPGAETLALETPQDKTANDWSPDGRFILFQSNDPKTGIDLWVWPRERNAQPYVFLRTGFAERRASFSPDGRWVTYLSNQSGRYEVYVRPFAEATQTTDGASTSGVYQISTAGGTQPLWNPNGREVHYLAPDGQLMSVPVKIAGTTLEAGASVALFKPSIVGADDVDSGLQYDIARDGRFLINTLSEDTSPITVIVNWTPPAHR